MPQIVEMAPAQKTTWVNRSFSGPFSGPFSGLLSGLLSRWFARHIYAPYPYDKSATGRVLQFPSARRSVEGNSAHSARG